jgi:hypothetical protein
LEKRGEFYRIWICPQGALHGSRRWQSERRIKISVYLGSNVETEIGVGQSTLITADDDLVQSRILSDGSSIQITLDAGRKGCFLIFCYYLKRMAFLYNESINPENHA